MFQVVLRVRGHREVGSGEPVDMACGMLGGHRRGARWDGGTPAGARRTDGDWDEVELGGGRLEHVRCARGVLMEAKLMCVCVGSGRVAGEHTDKVAARASGR